MSMGGLDFSQGSILGMASIVICAVSKISIPLAIVCGILTDAAIGAGEKAASFAGIRTDRMMEIEFVHITKDTTPEKLEDELFLKDLAWKLHM